MDHGMRSKNAISFLPGPQDLFSSIQSIYGDLKTQFDTFVLKALQYVKPTKKMNVVIPSIIDPQHWKGSTKNKKSLSMEKYLVVYFYCPKQSITKSR